MPGLNQTGTRKFSSPRARRKPWLSGGGWAGHRAPRFLGAGSGRLMLAGTHAPHTGRLQSWSTSRGSQLPSQTTGPCSPRHSAAPSPRPLLPGTGLGISAPPPRPTALLRLPVPSSGTSRPGWAQLAAGAGGGWPEAPGQDSERAQRREVRPKYTAAPLLQRLPLLQQTSSGNGHRKWAPFHGQVPQQGPPGSRAATASSAQTPTLCQRRPLGNADPGPFNFLNGPLARDPEWMCQPPPPPQAWRNLEGFRLEKTGGGTAVFPAASAGMALTRDTNNPPPFAGVGAAGTGAGGATELGGGQHAPLDNSWGTGSLPI